jgi:flagellar motor switch protein FliG
MKHPKPRFCLAKIVPAILLLGTLPSLAAGQNSPTAKSATADASAKTWSNAYREALERRTREVLQDRVDEYLAKRLDRSSYVIDFEFTFDDKRIAAEVAALQGADFDVIVSSVSNRRYEDLRKYFREASILLKFSKSISAAESGPVVKSLQNFLAVGANPIEVVRASSIALPPGPRERALEEKRKEQEMRGQTDARLRQLEHELKLKELEREYQLKKSGVGEGDEGGMKALLEQERKKREDLAEIVNKESMKDKIAREMPIILRFASVGIVFGGFVLLSLIVFGLFISSGLKNLAAGFRQGLEGLAGAMVNVSGGRGGGGGEKTTFEMKIDTGDGLRGGGGGGTSGGSGSQLDLGKMSALDNIVAEIRNLAASDIEMAAAIVSRLADRGEFERAFSMLDLLGIEMAQKTLALLPDQIQRGMKRRYLASEVKQPAVDELFQQAITVRALLTAGDQLLSDDSERLLARILLSHSDEELASGLASLPTRAAVSVLTRLPANKAMIIVRAAPKEQAREWRQALSGAMREEIPLVKKDLETLRVALRDPEKGRFEEAKEYFQEILSTADEKEFQEFLDGLESTPDLCLAVTGMRATMEDLWEQPLPIITSLFVEFTLEEVAILLYEAPESVRQTYLESCVERRRMMINDGLQGLAGNEQHRQKMMASMADSRKHLLKELGTMAEDGKTELPSRKRLLDKLESSRRLKVAA